MGFCACMASSGSGSGSKVAVVDFCGTDVICTTVSGLFIPETVVPFARLRKFKFAFLF